jgi:hypothetical protein
VDVTVAFHHHLHRLPLRRLLHLVGEGVVVPSQALADQTC